MKKFLSLLLSIILIASCFASIPMTANALSVSEFNSKLSSFQNNRYANGSTYVNDPGGTGGYQCFGFANELAKYIFGSYPTSSMSASSVNSGWSVNYGGSAVDNLCVGDIVRYHFHSIFITGISGNTIYYCQANVPDGTNRVTYGNSISRSSLKSKVSAMLTHSGATKTGWVAHYKNSPFTPGNPVQHTVNSNYGKNFTAYPKAKITAENIFDENHNQISSTAWIGVSDKCTIHEVYTDGCCKVSYPLSSGGTKTVYSYFSLFNPPHTHNYSGQRVYELDHPHAITQRCVDYASCGGYKTTGEYAEVKTCEKCWYATFDSSASSVSLKVGESKSITMTIDGCWPDTRVGHLDYDKSIVDVSVTQNTITFKGLNSGECIFRFIIYSDSAKSHVIGIKNIAITVAQPLKIHSSSSNVSLTLDGTKSATVYAWTSGDYDRQVVFGCDRNNDNITCGFGEWTSSNKLPLNINAVAPGTSTIKLSVKDKATREIIDTMIITINISDNTKPIGSITSTNKLSNYQEVTLKLSDNVGVAGYYWGTNLDYKKNYWFATNKSTATKTIQDEGTYYLVVKDTSGNISNVYSITFNKTTLNANGGSISPSYIITKNGNSMTLPTLSRPGYVFRGWSKSSTATSATYLPQTKYSVTSNSTLYAVWHKHKFDNACDGVCNECGVTRSVNHDYKWVIDKAATCTTEGVKHLKCSICHGTQKIGTKIAATGNHKYDNNDDATCNICGAIRTENYTGWLDKNGKKVYYEKGKLLTNRWINYKGTWYFVDASGYRVTDTWKDGAKGKCYLTKQGYMATNCWVNYKGTWYFVDASGYRVTDTWKDGAKGKCYLTKQGYMAVNKWINYKGTWYYVNNEGYRVTNKWVKGAEGWCWLTKNGYMATNGWIKDTKGWCYINDKGYAVSNCWKKGAEGWSYIGKDNYMVKNSWVKDTKGWAFVDEKGYSVSNCWKKNANGWFYIGKDNYIVTNTSLKIGGKVYRFNKAGVCTNR